MEFKAPEFKASKKEQTNSERYQREALGIAQRISRQWQKLKGKSLSDSQLQEIYDMNRPPQSGIQIWFEGQIKFISEQAGNENDKSRMMYRLKDDLERIEGKVNDII